jgi:hypothetical protein
VSRKTLIGVAATVVAPIIWVTPGLGAGAFRDDLDIYGAFMGTPLNLIFPVVAVFLTCGPTYFELGNRFVANVRTRLDIRIYLAARLWRTLAISFGTFFLFAFVPFVISFFVWPAIGNPHVDPAGYDLTPAQAIADSYSRYTFTSLLSRGDLTFGLVYASIVGSGGAVFAACGLVMLLLVRNRNVALAVPFATYLVESLGAALGGPPVWGLVYGLFPFHIAAAPSWQALAPLVVIAAVVTGLWVFTFRQARTLPNLA